MIDPHGTGDPDGIGLGKVDFPGQVAAPTHEEGQRNPGDFEAQVAQGPVTIHANETRGVTDEGVIMARRQIRKGIRALKQGRPLDWPSRAGANPLPTYNIELVSRVPRKPGTDDDATVRRFGRRVAEIVIESGDLPPGTRQETAKARVDAMIAEEFS